MRSKEQRVSDRRLCAATLSLFAVFVALLFTACAPPRGVSGYDGDLIPQSDADSTTLVRVHIENHRTIDAVDPTIYLSGSGRHSLGRIEGMGGKIERFIDTLWLGPDGCFQITAHYAGGGDLVFDRVCWRRGEYIEATLDNVFNSVASWSHR